jgi:uncharacterized protein YkwD
MFLRSLLVLFPLFISAPTPVLQTADEQAVAMRVIALVNDERKKAGCPALTVNPQLTAAAQGHSANMESRHFFSHVDPDGRQPWDRMLRAGYRYRIAAENIGAGFSTPEAMVRGWMNSPGHRENILNCKLEETGVGYVQDAVEGPPLRWRYYWTQDFGLGH